jgi:hypothetical protein
VVVGIPPWRRCRCAPDGPTSWARRLGAGGLERHRAARARAFARQGATVVLVARGEERLAAARQECVEEGAAASIALPADVLDQDHCTTW